MFKLRLEKIRRLLKNNNLDAILIMKPQNRRYISGFTGSSGIVLITLHNTYLFTDFRYVEQAQKEAPDFKIINQEKDIYERIAQTLQKNSVKCLAFEDDFVTFKGYKDLKEKIINTNLIPKSGLVEDLRKIKDEDELKKLKKAIKISDLAFEHIIKYIKPGVSEIDIALELEFFMRTNGAEDIAFPTIVASGERGSLPHGTPINKKVTHGDFVTMDFGAVFQGYHSDITRTICIGKPSVKQQEIYNLVLKAQTLAEEKIEVGMTGKYADNIARDIIKKAGYGDKFGHGLGHGVGLAIHESPTLSFRNGETLQEGMVVTIEPGIYISGWGGVRIEDIILITAKGSKVLTKANKELIYL